MIKQYVNLPNNAANHYGASVNLVVNANQLADASTAYTEWWVEATGADNVKLKYLASNSRARMRYRTRHHAGTRFRNTLLLPHVGGDKYKVKCSKRGDRSSPVEMEEIETWRKVFYSVHWMNNACRDTFNSVKARFKAAFEESFIEMEEVGFAQALVDEPKTRVTDNTPHLPHLYRRRPVLADKPWHLRIVVLNDIYEMVEMRYRVPLAGMKQATMNTGPLSDISATHFRRHARARMSNPSHGGWINVSSMITRSDDTHVGIDFTGHAGLSAHIDNGGTVDLDIGTRERDHYLGHSIGNFVCVRINETGTPAAIQQTILQTFTHEVGHGFQQVVKKERIHNAAGNFTEWKANRNWHTNSHGGVGPHCKTNAVSVRAAANNPTPSGRTYQPSGGTLCTMFFRDDPLVDAAGLFCANCKPRLRRVNLGRVKMRSKHWNDY